MNFNKIFSRISILINSKEIKLHFELSGFFFFQILNCLRYKLFSKLMVPNKLILESIIIAAFEMNISPEEKKNACLSANNF